ncbi:MAG: STAS domain-containing protein [Parvularculales bacterium]
MEIEETKEGSVVVVSPVGRIDGSSAAGFQESLTGIVDRGDANILLDCSKMIYISSAGLRSVLIGSRKCQEGGGKLVLCALQHSCKEVMDVSGFLSIIENYDARDEAVKAFT